VTSVKIGCASCHGKIEMSPSSGNTGPRSHRFATAPLLPFPGDALSAAPLAEPPARATCAPRPAQSCELGSMPTGVGLGYVNVFGIPGKKRSLMVAAQKQLRCFRKGY